MNLHDYLHRPEAPSQATFGKSVGVSQGMVYQWLSGKRPVSVESCIAIERETGGAVTCEELRPDIDWAYLRNRGNSPAEAA